MSYRDLFTEKEWRTLQCVPWWVFYTAAGTDRMLDLKEIGVLLAMLSGKTEMDPLTRDAQIHVSCRDYVVTLEGVVRTEEGRRQAELNAWCLFAVDRVVNRIAVQK